MKKITQNLLLITICCLSLTATKAQYVSIPDSNFVHWLKNNGYASCFNGSQLDTTCPAVVNDTSMNCSSSGILDVTGIQYFHSLKNLDCSDNIHINIPSLPNSLTTFSCNFDSLTSLPLLPISLLALNCVLNPLVSLPTLPYSLTSLVCEGDSLTSLPTLPLSLRILDCQINNLTSIPALPDTMVYFNCSKNRNLYCLPKLGSFNDLDFSNTGVSCLPNYPQVSGMCIPMFSFVPHCNVFNPNGCATYWNISGKVYQDTNHNCILDTNEYVSQNMHLNLFDSTGILLQQTYTDPYGFYSFDTHLGKFTYTVDTTNVPYMVTCPTNGIDSSNLSVLDSTDYNKNFAVNCKPGFDVGAWSVAQITWQGFRAARFTYIRVSAGDFSQFFGMHCAAGHSGQVVVTISGPVTYSSSSGTVSPSSISGNVLTYNIADFDTFDIQNSIEFILQTDTTAIVGQQICITVDVTPTFGDNDTTNNHLSICYQVVASLDPNVKEVSPVKNIDTTQQWLTYTIHFQNTGNAAAQNIYVLDTLSNNVDESTFQLLAYSVRPLTQIKGKVVRFNFPNINLPDSTANEPQSHAWVQYRVKSNKHLALGSTIKNTASIYFDFNQPVATNTTSNTVGLTSDISTIQTDHLSFTIFPNPTNEDVNIAVSKQLIGEEVSVQDVTGRTILTDHITRSNFRLVTSNLSAGVYFVKVQNVVKKFVKE